MSMLSDLRAAIEAHDQLRLVTENEYSNQQYGQRVYHHSVEMFLAPSPGVYDKDRLNLLMRGLTVLRTTEFGTFTRYHNRQMAWGWMQFVEPVAEVLTVGTKTYTVLEPDVRLPNDAQNGVPVDISTTDKLWRRIVLIFYPSSKYARDGSRGMNKFVSDGPMVRTDGLTLVRG